jgi:hypothetical protein
MYFDVDWLSMKRGVGELKTSLRSVSNRVVHSSHFSLIFVFIFDLIFHLKFKNVFENEAENETFCKMDPSPPHFAKSIIFQLLIFSNSTSAPLMFGPLFVQHTPNFARPPPPKFTLAHLSTMPTSKRIRKLTSKAAANSVSTDSSDGELKPGKRAKPRRIVWNVDWIELLLDWLEENPKERQKLFSDSSKDAKDEGRCKHVAKGSKSEFHRMIAAVVFSVDSDADICVDFQVNPTNYTKSVDNYIIR